MEANTLCPSVISLTLKQIFIFDEPNLSVRKAHSSMLQADWNPSFDLLATLRTAIYSCAVRGNLEI
jgi:hypothetical protein